jgi:3-isopropylmalate/(R)-2-methylmalate dehydratase large subunit
MGQTIVEKVLAAHSDEEEITAGEILRCRPDLVLAHDLSVPLAIEVFREIGVGKVTNPEKLVFVQDHFQPAKDVDSAHLGAATREFALKQGVKNYYEVGWGGICHNVIIEKGLAVPGMLIAGADSHTLTCGAVGAIGFGIGATELAALWALGEIWLDVPKSRKIHLNGQPPEFIGGKDIILSILGQLGQEGAMNECIEYYGTALEFLGISDRITIANMSAEAGATTAIIQLDKKSLDWLKERTNGPFEIIEADADAEYVDEMTVDVAKLVPMVAVPDSPANAMPVDEVGDVKVDQVFLGSCSNGSIEDLRKFIDVVGNKQFSKKVRVLVTPATQDVYREALEEEIVRRIIDAGGAVQTPSCGPCIGGHSGVLGRDEVCLSTTNRNFKGRMGHPESRVYLAGPEVAAATAVTGKITPPSKVAGH